MNTKFVGRYLPPGHPILGKPAGRPAVGVTGAVTR